MSQYALVNWTLLLCYVLLYFLLALTLSHHYAVPLNLLHELIGIVVVVLGTALERWKGQVFSAATTIMLMSLVLAFKFHSFKQPECVVKVKYPAELKGARIEIVDIWQDDLRGIADSERDGWLIYTKSFNRKPRSAIHRIRVTAKYRDIALSSDHINLGQSKNEISVVEAEIRPFSLATLGRFPSRSDIIQYRIFLSGSLSRKWQPLSTPLEHKVYDQGYYIFQVRERSCGPPLISITLLLQPGEERSLDPEVTHAIGKLGTVEIQADIELRGALLKIDGYDDECTVPDAGTELRLREGVHSISLVSRYYYSNQEVHVRAGNRAVVKATNPILKDPIFESDVTELRKPRSKCKLIIKREGVRIDMLAQRDEFLKWDRIYKVIVKKGTTTIKCKNPRKKFRVSTEIPVDLQSLIKRNFQVKVKN